MNTYSSTRILLHWIVALLVLGLFASGFWMVELNYYSKWYTRVPHWHKSVGVLLLFLWVISVIWRRITKKPEHEKEIKTWERFSAMTVQAAMSILILVVIISGYLITTANGDAVSVFNWFDLPATISDIKNQEDLSGKYHRWMAYALIALVVLHTSAALFHHFIKKDRTLLKMLGK